LWISSPIACKGSFQKKKKVKIGAYSFTSCHFLGRFQLRSFGNGGHCARVTIYRYL
jgi:hypothetical protein